ncbi:unnamed protein product [Phaeothamnion confervicola]
MALRKAVFSPVLSNNMDPDSFRAQYTFRVLWRDGAGAHRALANLVRPGLEVRARQECLLLATTAAGRGGSPTCGRPFSSAAWRRQSKCVTAARHDGGASPAYGAVETADHSFTNPCNHHHPRGRQRMQRQQRWRQPVQPSRPPPAKTRWTRKPPGATGDDDRGSGIAAFGRLGSGGDAGQCGGGDAGQFGGGLMPHLPFSLRARTMG